MDFSLINLTLKKGKTLDDMLSKYSISLQAFNYFYSNRVIDNVTYYTLKNDTRILIGLEDVNSDKKFLSPAFDLIDEIKNKDSKYGLMSIRDWSANGITEIKQKLKDSEADEGNFYLNSVVQYDQIVSTIKASYSEYFNLGVVKNQPLKDRYKNASKYKVGYTGSGVNRRQLAKMSKSKMKSDAPNTYNKYQTMFKTYIQDVTGQTFKGTNDLETVLQALTEKYDQFIAANKQFFDDLYLNNDSGNRIAVSADSQRQYKDRMIEMLDKQKLNFLKLIEINKYVKFDTPVSVANVQRMIKDIENRKKIIDLRIEATHATLSHTDADDDKPDEKVVDFLSKGAPDTEKEQLIKDLINDKDDLIGILNDLNKIKAPPKKTEYTNFRKQITEQINRIDQFIEDIKNLNSEQLLNQYKYKKETNTDLAKLIRKPNTTAPREPPESKTQDTADDSVVQNPQQVQTNVAQQPPPQTARARVVQPPPAVVGVAPPTPNTQPAPNTAAAGSGIVEELRNYLKRYQEIPFYSKTDEANRLQTELQQALATDRNGNFIRPDKINQEELRKHRDYFAKNVGIAGKTKAQLKSNQEKEQANDLIDQAVRDAKILDKREKEEEKDIKLKELRPDINEGKDLYEGIDKGEKQLNNQSQFLKKQVQIKDEEIKLLKQKLDEKRNQDFNSQLSGIAPVFRNLLNIQIGDIFAEDYTDYVDSIF